MTRYSKEEKEGILSGGKQAGRVHGSMRRETGSIRIPL
jgi:hypothetical protein